ncbi:unnamed protein product [Durusdinium trenchii]|uniref:Uncharacterized protein n=1 Tax=Durusdinium trenchii TaxID=1381693 RepID=A0ABP0SVA9_9DINO
MVRTRPNTKTKDLKSGYFFGKKIFSDVANQVRWSTRYHASCQLAGVSPEDGKILTAEAAEWFSGLPLGWTSKKVEIDQDCREVIAARMREGYLHQAEIWKDVSEFQASPDTLAQGRFLYLEDVKSILTKQKDMQKVMHYLVQDFNLRPLASYITSWNECNELPMHRWLSAGIVDDEHESRLKICGNLVVPKCADLALQVFQRVKEILCKENSEGERTQWTFLGHKASTTWRYERVLGAILPIFFGDPRGIISNLLAVEATKNDIGQKYQADCQKYIDLMKLPEYGLQKAAEYLEHWFAGDFGISGMVDPEVAENLMELYLQEGFMSDPSMIGVEQVAATQDWESASGVARAFQIGKAESSALFALVKEVPERIRESLEAMVKARGMTKLFTHKIIGKGTFSACGCFLFFLQKFKAIVPEKELAEMERGLRSQFMSGFLDGDLLHVLEEQVPLSADIKAVGAFRPFVTQVEQGRIRDKEAAAQALAKQVASAQYAQVEAMVKADMQILKDKLPGKDDQAIENAKNLKYMKERYVVASMDMTVYPANSELVRSAHTLLNAICSMTPNAAGWVQLPVHQSQTTQHALIKHRQALESTMLNSKQNLSREVVILFSKPDSNSRDGRNMAQGAILTVHQQYHNETPWDASSAVEDGRLGPCDLVKGMDLKPADRLIWVDIIPNRQAEFGRACLEMQLKSSAIPVKYCGVLKGENVADLRSAFESAVYDHWDEHPTLAPPRERPTTAPSTRPDLGLEVLSMQGMHPIFPAEVLLNRFSEGSEERTLVKKLQKEFEDIYPPPAPGTNTQTQNSSSLSMSADCDFSDGHLPINPRKNIELQCIPISDFRAERWDVARLTSLKTCVYRPNALDANERKDIKKRSLGGVFAGNYHKVPQNANVSLMWEVPEVADPQATAADSDVNVKKKPVGGKRIPQEKSLEIAQLAADRLRAGESHAKVRIMVDEMKQALRNFAGSGDDSAVQNAIANLKKGGEDHAAVPPDDSQPAGPPTAETKTEPPIENEEDEKEGNNLESEGCEEEECAEEDPTVDN